MEERKILIVDTSVLLYDKDSIQSFPGNDVFFTLTVLDELDKFKDRPGLLGESARHVNRFLDDLRLDGSLHDGVHCKDLDQTYRVWLSDLSSVKKKLKELDYMKGDNNIIASAVQIKELFPDRQVKVITKDINLRVKCDALNIDAEDYYSDHLDLEDSDFVGFSKLELTKGKNLIKLHDLRLSQTETSPRNKEQKFALHALNDDKIPLVTLTGLAGSGKTFLTLMSAIEALDQNRYERIIVTRNIQPVGKEIGYLPGGVKEKMAPWMSPLMDNFRHHFKDRTYFEIMMDKGLIEIAPLSFIRGRTFSNSFIIVDEAQNASIHELKTIITRIGENSKIVLMGDTDQIDTPYLNKKSNGLAIVIDRMKNSEHSAHVHLKRGERSELATYASKVL
jgi:PhoH-like ATPase